MESKTEDRMGRATALGILAHMAQDRNATLDEVRALQVACRNVAKRLFDNERHFKRKREAGTAEVYITPPCALAEAARQDAAPPKAEEAVSGRAGAVPLEDVVRYVAAKMREMFIDLMVNHREIGEISLAAVLENWADALEGKCQKSWEPSVREWLEKVGAA